MPTVPTFVPYVAGAGLVGFGLWKFLHRKPHVQSVTVGDDAGNVATVSVPTSDDDPQASASVTPPTSDDVSQVVSDDDVADNIVAEPDGRGGYVHRRHRRRFIAPPITPGLLPYAPQVTTPYGVAPFAIRSRQDVQYGLNALGYGPLKIDGRIGPVSTAAIVEFQRRNNLPPVGYRHELHAHLQNAIARAVPRITAPGTRPIVAGRARDGSVVIRGEVASRAASIGAEAVVATASAATPIAVAKATNTVPIATPAHVQAALNAAGATPALKVDGTLGPKSIAATKAFQISAGLVADGVPGPKTRTALAVACAPPSVCIPCSCPVPTPVSFPYEPVLEGRNELFKGWAATHHLGSRVDCARYEFGLEGAEGTGPEASAYFKGAHLPFGTDSATPHTPYYGASFKHAHSPFGGASFAHAHSPFGAHGAGGGGGGHHAGGGAPGGSPASPPTSGMPTGASNPTHAPPPVSVGQRPAVAAAVQASSPAPFSRPSSPSGFVNPYASGPMSGLGNFSSGSLGSFNPMAGLAQSTTSNSYGGYGGYMSGGFYGDGIFEESEGSYGTHQFGAAGKKKQFAKPKTPGQGWNKRKFG